MIHYQTTNTSCLKMYYLLKELGVKNNTFFLELYDETLAEVNPLDPNLPEMTKIKVLREIQRNFWYYAREIVKIPASGLIDFEFNRGNLALLWSLSHNLNTYCILPRQSFKTYTVAVYYSWLIYYGGFKTDIMHFSYADAILKSNLQRIKNIRDQLPEYVRVHDARKDKDNENEIWFKELGNTIKIKAPSQSKDEASKIGRGFSTPVQWYDEFAFIPNIKEQYESSLFAYTTVAKNAKKNGLPHHKVMTTTAGFLNTEEGKYTYNFLIKCCDFNEQLYDYSEEGLEDYIEKNSKNGFIRVEYMYYDLGKPDNYLDEQRKEVDEDVLDREVLNRWKDVSKEHPLGQERMALLATNKHEPTTVFIIDEIYFLKFYRDVDDMDWAIPYIIGLDCGGNLTRDFTTVVVTDPRNFEVVAVMRTNSYSNALFIKALYKIMTKYFPYSILIPERNNMGITVIDDLIGLDRALKPRVYHDQDEKPGVFTNEKIRTLLYNEILRTAVVEDAGKIHDRTIIDEIQTLVISRQGRIDHDKNAHDDTLIAYLYTRWFLIYAKRRERYIPIEYIGIEASNVDDEVAEIRRKHTMNTMRVIHGNRVIDTSFMANIDERGHIIEPPEMSGESILDQSFSNIRSRMQSISVEEEAVELDKVVEDTTALNEDELYGKDPDEVRYFAQTQSSNHKVKKAKSVEEENPRDYSALVRQVFNM